MTESFSHEAGARMRPAGDSLQAKPNKNKRNKNMRSNGGGQRGGGRRSKNGAAASAAAPVIAEDASYRLLFEQNPLPLCVVDRQSFQFLEVNDAMERCYGFKRSEFLEMTLRDLEPVSDHERTDPKRASLDPTRERSSLWRHIAHDGRAVDVELSIRDITWGARKVWLITVRDVTERQYSRLDPNLRDRAIEVSTNGVFICAAEERNCPVRYVNSAMEKFLGKSRDVLLGQPFAELLLGQAAEDTDRLIETLHEGNSAHTVIASQFDARDTVWLEIQVTPVPDDNGVFRRWLGIVQDITERKQFEATLEYQARHDSLTGLPNRDLLRQRLKSAIASAKTVDYEVAVLYLGFDNLKKVNDIAGHDAGDRYLETLALRLGDRIRDDDVLARVSGDEFVVITVGPDLADALPKLATRLQSAFEQAVTIAGQEFRAHCSIGIALYPLHGKDAEILLKRADMTMYMAKRDPNHAIQWFSAPMEASFQRRAEIESALQRALKNDEFELHYQPQVDMRRGAVVGMEALLRWPNAAESYRGPAHFIPVAEESGFISAIGGWVLERACSDLAKMRRKGHTAVTVAVNASAVQLREPDFADRVSALLEQHAIPANMLEIEITESVLMAEFDVAEGTLRALNEMGVRLAIDDFGTGFSSLSYLRRLPIHRLKIDRSFIFEMGDSERASELVRNVASMANSLNLEPLAEGVEDGAAMRSLISYECFLGQGFYFSHAIPMQQMLKLMAEKKPLDAPGE